MEKISGKAGVYKFLMYLVVVVLINIAGTTLFFRTDLTANRVYSLSEASRDAVATLSEPLTVKVFFSTNLPAPYNNIERYLHDLFQEYAIAGNKYFNYQFYNLSAEEGGESDRNQQLAESYGIHPVQIQNIEQDEVKFQRAYMGLAMMHGDIIETLPTVTSTEGLEYKITSAIRKMNNKISALLRLEERVKIKLFLSSSLKAVGPYMNLPGLTALAENVEEVVNRLNRKNYDKVSFLHLDPSTDPAHESEAERYDVLGLAWNSFSDRRGVTIPGDKGYAGIIVEHGDNFESVRLIEVIRLPIFGTQYQLTDLDDLELILDKSVENVISINEEIGYLADFGTLTLGLGATVFGQGQPGGLTNLNRLLSDNYTIREVRLKEEGIPDNLSLLLIAGPKEPFSDHALYEIDQFLMKGKSLAIFLDSFNEVSPQGQNAMMGQPPRTFHVPLDTGLEKLLSHYGVSVKKSVVLDENCFRQRVPQSFGGGERAMYFAPIIKNEMINKDARYLRNIKGLVMVKSSPVVIDKKRMDELNLTADRLFSSSEKSWEMTERIELNPMFLSPPADEKEFSSYALAYSVSGSFPSYFADRPIPEREDGSDEQDKAEGSAGDMIDMSEITAEGATIGQGRPGKIFLIGTSEILGDNVIDEEGNTPNAQFVMNVVDYLNGREDTAVMRSKTQKFNPLREVTPAARTSIKTANIAGLPVLVILAGVFVWFRRMSRKRKIEKLFSQ